MKIIIILIIFFLAGISGIAQVDADESSFSKLLNKDGLSPALEVFKMDWDKQYIIDGKAYTIGAGFQPSVLLDSKESIHVFFQARLNSSDDKAEKMIAHVVSHDGGESFSDVRFINKSPMQTYAISSFIHETVPGIQRISLLTSLSIDETISKLKDKTVILEQLGIDISRFSRKGAALILEYYSDDLGITWKQKQHYGISDQIYQRNGKNFYLAFINLIGQVRKIEQGKYKGRLILGGPIRGDYLPVKDHPTFREYSPSSSIIYSDDEGESWMFGGIIKDSTAFNHNEASAVPVNYGDQILLVRRSNNENVKGKTMHLSNDGGTTWENGFTTNIPATKCLQVLDVTDDLILCSTPAKKNRSEGTIFFSSDNGKTWTPRLIEKTAFSYSTVNHLSGSYFICVYSRGYHGAFGINARIFSVDWLM